MRAKTISAILAKKHKEWTDSITDEKVRALAIENTIITGGCIVSLLLGEKVNDYDMYFTDRNTAFAVAKYYVDKFNVATGQRVNLEEEGGRIKVWVQSAGIASENGADGYKYFEQDPDPSDGINFVDQALAVVEADEEKPKYRPVFLSSNAITLSSQVQLIIRFYGDADEIHSNYDFAHCTSYWTSSNHKLVLRPQALEAILAKELVYQGSKYPVASVIRTRKFIQRGWVINAGQYIKMIMQINDLNLKDPRVLEDQLTGVDFAYFAHVIDYLRERKEKDKDFEITAAYVCEIIDRIF